MAAMDGMTSMVRNLIGQENIEAVMKTFEVIRTGVISLNTGIKAIIENQKEMERRADLRHKEILALFAQLGVQPKTDAALIEEHRITQ